MVNFSYSSIKNFLGLERRVSEEKHLDKKWYLFTGSWRKWNRHVQRDVIRNARGVIRSGNGIVVGGALRVDYLATKVALDEGNPNEQLKIFLPTGLGDYLAHIGNAATNFPEQRTVQRREAELLSAQFQALIDRSPESIYVHDWFRNPKTNSYHARNKQEVLASDRVYAFHVDNSKGVQNTIDFAKDTEKLPTYVYRYEIDKPGWIENKGLNVRDSYNYKNIKQTKRTKRILTEWRNVPEHDLQKPKLPIISPKNPYDSGPLDLYRP